MARADSVSSPQGNAASLGEKLFATRRLTLDLAAPLSDADATVQPFPDASPAKWHLAHTTWFFETFVLRDHVPGYTAYDDRFAFLFNSYYEAEGERHARPKRGTIVRPKMEWNQLDPTIITWSGNAELDLSPGAVAHRLDQLIEVRHIIEPASAALAARRGTPEDFARIKAAYAAMEAAGTDAEAFMQADLNFHVACLRAAHNDFLLPIAHAIRTAMKTSLSITTRDPHENRNVSLPLHRAIHDAIIARDEHAAVAAMQRHLKDTEKRRAQAAGRSAV